MMMFVEHSRSDCVWADKKHLTKKAAAAARRSASATGGGPSDASTLSQVELKILSIMGEGFGGPQTEARMPAFPLMTVGPWKYLIRDLLNVPPPIEVWLQGTIEQTVGTDILIIADSSGRAKITKCDSADGIIDKRSLRKGTYCCIIGTAVKTKGLPEIQASKFLDLTAQPQMRHAWESEVREVNLFLQGKVLPSI